MNVLKNLGLGAAMVTTGAMLMGTPVTPKLNTTPSHINYATGYEDQSKMREYYEKSRIYDSKGLDCSDGVKRYIDTYLSDGYKVYNYSKFKSFYKSGTRTTQFKVTDDLYHPTFNILIMDMSEREFKGMCSQYKKVGSSYYLSTDYSESDGVHREHYFYPGNGNNDGIYIYYEYNANGDVLPNSYSSLH